MAFLSLMFTMLTYKDIETFFIYLCVFGGFCVWSGLLPMWILVLNLIIIVLILGNNLFRGKSI